MRKQVIRIMGTTLIVGAFLFLAYGSEDSKGGKSKSGSSSSSKQVKCGYCGANFDKGTGYNTLARVISSPEIEYSHYCSRRCAKNFLRDN